MPERYVDYAIVIEQAEASSGAYVPDLPRCVAVADSEEEVRDLVREAIEFHLDGMREDGEPIPRPTSRVGYVNVPVAA
ncbi:MAG TPA: type II toxin-antitoxin system HicB family antitoxin [Longimicrobium sp.]|jgi:predicted RNase H-like HicB family nuclease